MAANSFQNGAPPKSSPNGAKRGPAQQESHERTYARRKFNGRIVYEEVASMAPSRHPKSKQNGEPFDPKNDEKLNVFQS